MNAINILTVLQLRIDENEIIWTITNDTRFCAITLCVSWFSSVVLFQVDQCADPDINSHNAITLQQNYIFNKFRHLPA